MARCDLSDEEWAVIEPLLPIRGRGAKHGDDRMTVTDQNGYKRKLMEDDEE